MQISLEIQIYLYYYPKSVIISNKKSRKTSFSAF